MAYGLPNPETLAGRREQMFPTLTDAQFARIAPLGVERTFEDGDIIAEQGDLTGRFYVVIDGELEIVHPRGTLEDPIIVLTRMEFTGEANLIDDRRALVRTRARGRLTALCVEHGRLRALIQTDSELSELIMRAFILRRVALITGGLGDVIVIGSRDSAATQRLQAFLLRNRHPSSYVDVDRDRDVEALLHQFHVDAADIPILVCRGEVVLRNPTDAEVAECLGFNPVLEPGVVHDVVVCGAGPGGLAAAVYGASEGLDVFVIDADSPGGQAASSSKIENYLGFPTGISGPALAARAVAQAEKFGARISVACSAHRIDTTGFPFRIELSNGGTVCARAIVVATGVDYRKIDVPDLERFEGVGVYYSATFLEAQRCTSDDVIVIGGGNSAGQAATFLARTSSHVHVLIRGPDLAASMSRYLIRRIEETPNITLHRRTRVVALHGTQHLERVTWRDEAAGEESTHAMRHVFTMAGASPNTEWLRGAVATDANGFVYTGSDLTRDTLAAAKWPLSRPPYVFETSHPRIFAVGDVRANSTKRVAAAVGEGSVCMQLVHRVLNE